MWSDIIELPRISLALMSVSKWFMHNGHNTGQKIQKSAIFGTYLPNLEALCHEFALVFAVCTVFVRLGRTGPHWPAPAVQKLEKILLTGIFFTLFLLFFAHCRWIILLSHSRVITDENSSHWHQNYWNLWKLSPAASNTLHIFWGTNINEKQNAVQFLSFI